MDTQRLIAFVVFSFSLLMLWEAWQDYQQPKPARETAQSVPAAPRSEVPDQVPALAADQSIPSAGQTVAGAQAPQGTRVVVKTDVLNAVVDANGGDIRQLTLTQYRQNDDQTKPFELFEERAGRNYFAQSGFIGEGWPTHKTVYTVEPGEHALKPGQNELKLTMSADLNGLRILKTYTFRRGSYVVDLDYRISNLGDKPMAGYPYYQLLRHGQPPEGESSFMHTYTGPALYTEAGKFQKVDFQDIAKGKQEHIKEAKDGWLGMVQHHFVAAWMPRDPADSSPREFRTTAIGNDEYTASLILPARAIELAPGENKTASARLYAGPQKQEELKALAPGLEHVVDYGWLTILAYPMFVLLSWLHKLVDNWGVAIILLTVLIKAAFYPLSAASYKSMAQMRKFAPRMQQLKERYGDDRQKLHEAMMKIYKEEKINPLGGCLPMLVQIPFFIALYWVLLSAVELRQAPFALWITDLSEKDPYYVLPVLMAISMFIQTKLSPPSPDPMQQKVMMFMPLAFSVFFFFFPAGLVLYWLVNQLLSILQQWRINTVIARADGKPDKAK